MINSTLRAVGLLLVTTWLALPGAGDDGPSWRHHLEQAEVLNVDGDTAAAYREYQKALAAATRPEARSEVRIALADLLLAPDPEPTPAEQREAEHLYHESLEELKEVGTSDEARRSMIVIRNNMAVLLLEQGRAIEARALLADLAPSQISADLLAPLLYNRGLATERIDHPLSALQDFLDAVTADSSYLPAIRSAGRLVLSLPVEHGPENAARTVVHFVKIGELAAAELLLTRALELWGAGPALISSLAGYLASARVGAQEFQQRWKPLLKSKKQPGINTLEAIYTGNLDLDSLPKELPGAKAWSSETNRHHLVEFLEMVGDYANRAAEHPAAAARYSLAWRLDPGHFESFYRLVRVLGSTGSELDPDGRRLDALAVELQNFQEVGILPKQSQDIADALLMLGLAAADQGRPGTTVTHLKKATHVYRALGTSEPPFLYFQLAEAELALDHAGLALESYLRAAKLYKSIDRLEITVQMCTNALKSIDGDSEGHSNHIDALEEVLIILGQVLGEDHLETLATMTNVATTYKRRGNYVWARRIEEEVLAIHRRVLRMAHPNTLTSMNNLASTLKTQGKLSDARALAEEALSISRRVLGPEHPATLMSMNSLASTLEAQGDLPSARELTETSFSISRRVLGPEHSSTLTAMNNLALTLYAQGDLIRAGEYFEESLRILQERAPGSLDVATSFNNLGVLASDRGDLDRASEYFGKSLGISQKRAPGGLEVAASLNNLGILAADRGDLDRAFEYFEHSLEIRQKAAADSLEVAASFSNLGHITTGRGDLNRTFEYYEKSPKIAINLAPGSLDVVESLRKMGISLGYRGELNRAFEYYEKSLEIKRKAIPGSLDVALSLENLGTVTYYRGDLDLATEYFEESLEIIQRLAPESLGMAGSLNNLGKIAQKRGDLSQADEYYKKSLEIKEKLAPGSLNVAVSLNSLGSLAFARRDLDRAAEYFKKSLSILQFSAPSSLDVAKILNNLGSLASYRGDLDQAAKYFENSLEISQKLAPGSLDLAASLNNLGSLAADYGNLDQAFEYFNRSLDICQKLAPGSLDVAEVLSNLGELASGRGDLDRATEYYEKSLRIQKKSAPGSSEEAKLLHNMAIVRLKQSQPRPALSLFLQALQAHENQITKLGGSLDIQAGFRAERLTYYRDTINLSLKLQQPEEAFHILERSRGRSFLTHLAERDLLLSDIPKELERQRRHIALSYDEIQAKLGQFHPREHAEEVEALLTQLRQLRRDSEDVTEKILKASPKLGALRYPQPLDFDSARQALDPGTVMLSYSVDTDETHLFILTREDRLQVRTLPFGENKLRREVEKVLRLQRRRHSALYEGPLRQAGENLYRALIVPAEESIARNARVLIVPDGPLHLLPFSLLTRKTGQGKEDYEYLVEWKPLHSVLSATVYVELKNQRRSSTDKSRHALALAAFGDPQYSAVGTGNEVDLWAALERGPNFRSLPSTREEVNRIVALYPKGTARAFLGVEASEEQVKSVGRNARILHFATHGRFDDHFPMNSFLALTIPKEFRKGKDNGLLQTWEIIEDVRLDADLVVLSACESGVGDELGGEGLIGLTRAFQFAGARTVASSLWRVDDRATAELMVRFHRHLRTGTSKDESLRAAQLELIRGPVEIRDRNGQAVERDLSLPYYWAAFQVIGDWR